MALLTHSCTVVKNSSVTQVSLDVVERARMLRGMFQDVHAAQSQVADDYVTEQVWRSYEREGARRECG